MKEVLFANLGWVVLLTAWCVAYFIQARVDRSRPPRYEMSDASND